MWAFGAIDLLADENHHCDHVILLVSLIILVCLLAPETSRAIL